MNSTRSVTLYVINWVDWYLEWATSSTIVLGETRRPPTSSFPGSSPGLSMIHHPETKVEFLYLGR